MAVLGLIIAIVLGCPEPDSKPDPARQLARSSCVRVVNSKQAANGTGAVVGSDKGFLYVLTASHVIAGANQLEVQFAPDKDGKTKSVTKVGVLANDPTRDVALLRVTLPGAKIPAVPIALALEEEKDFDGISAGYAEAAEPEIRVERVLAKKLLRRERGDRFVWECRDRPDTGRSGGALLNKEGKLIGICSGTQDGKGYYCHLNEIQQWLKEQNHAWLWQGGAENGKK